MKHHLPTCCHHLRIGLRHERIKYVLIEIFDLNPQNWANQAILHFYLTMHVITCVNFTWWSKYNKFANLAVCTFFVIGPMLQTKDMSYWFFGIYHVFSNWLQLEYSACKFRHNSICSAVCKISKLVQQKLFKQWQHGKLWFLLHDANKNHMISQFIVMRRLHSKFTFTMIALYFYTYTCAH